METDHLFHYSSRRIAEFSAVQVRLYHRDIRPQNDFLHIQLAPRSAPEYNANCAVLNFCMPNYEPNLRSGAAAGKPEQIIQ
jgi:hypothetical protein